MSYIKHIFQPGEILTSTELNTMNDEIKVLADWKDSGAEESDIPEYWQSNLDDGISNIDTAIESAGSHKSSFLFYTDAHWGYGSSMSPRLLKYIGQHTAINKTIFGGDFANTYEYPDTGKTDADWMAIMREYKLAVRDIPNHHSVVGNHDHDIQAISTNNGLYGFLMAPEETDNIVRGGDFFYYIDDPNEKTRYFYLNTALEGGFSDEQCSFVIDNLTNLKATWHAVFISHIWFVYYNESSPTVGYVPQNIQKLLTMLDDYNKRASSSITITTEPHNYNFSSCEGWVEFCIGGHTHVDYDFTSDDGIPVVLCQTDSKHVRTPDVYEEGTIKEASVSGIVANYLTKKLSIIRVGRGTSREVNLLNHNVPSYTNILPTLVGDDGTTIYNGKGWKENTRWSQSSQQEVQQSGSYLTGWIPVSPGDTLYMQGITANSESTFFQLYLSNSVGSTSGSVNYDYVIRDYTPNTTDGSGNITKFTIPSSLSDYSYIRIGCNGIDNNSIITKNQPID